VQQLKQNFALGLRHWILSITGAEAPKLYSRCITVLWNSLWSYSMTVFLYFGVFYSMCRPIWVCFRQNRFNASDCAYSYTVFLAWSVVCRCLSSAAFVLHPARFDKLWCLIGRSTCGVQWNSALDGSSDPREKRNLESTPLLNPLPSLNFWLAGFDPKGSNLSIVNCCCYITKRNE